MSEASPVYDAVAADLDELTIDSPIFESLRAVAETLADLLDEANEGTAPQLARQLRETLTTIAALAGGADADRLAALSERLSAPVLDTPKKRPAKSRPRSRGSS